MFNPKMFARRTSIPKMLTKRMLTQGCPTYVPEEVVDKILEYLYAPVPFKVGRTYYVSYRNSWNEPSIERITVYRMSGVGRSAMIWYLKYVLPITSDPPETWKWQELYSGCSFVDTDPDLGMDYFVIRPRSNLFGLNDPILLYSRHTSDEHSAFRVLWSRVAVCIGYSWYYHIKGYCAYRGIFLEDQEYDYMM
jgi:hypothetical protein